MDQAEFLRMRCFRATLLGAVTFGVGSIVAISLTSGSVLAGVVVGSIAALALVLVSTGLLSVIAALIRIARRQRLLA